MVPVYFRPVLNFNMLWVIKRRNSPSIRTWCVSRPVWSQLIKINILSRPVLSKPKKRCGKDRWKERSLTFGLILENSLYQSNVHLQYATIHTIKALKSFRTLNMWPKSYRIWKVICVLSSMLWKNFKIPTNMSFLQQNNRSIFFFFFKHILAIRLVFVLRFSIYCSLSSERTTQ